MEEQNKNVEETQQEEVKKEHKPLKRFIVIGIGAVIAAAAAYIIHDATGRKNGRGAYLCFSKECLEKARKNKGLERSFKQTIPKEVYENLEKELENLEVE